MDNVNVELIKFIQDNVKPSFVEVEGVTYQQGTNNQLCPINKVIEDSALVKKSLDSFSLRSVLTYITENPDNIPIKDMLIQISSYKQVLVTSRLRDYGNRDIYLKADFLESDKILNTFVDMENFLINIYSTFQDTQELREFIQVVSSVRDFSESKLADDGISQVASTKAGIDLVSEKKLPKLVNLTPITTFLEVEQPKRPFLFRIKKGSNNDILFALYECDGGAYKNECLENIRNFFANNEGIKEKGVVII